MMTLVNKSEVRKDKTRTYTKRQTEYLEELIKKEEKIVIFISILLETS